MVGFDRCFPARPLAGVPSVLGESMQDQQLVDAIPSFSDAALPEDRARKIDDDAHQFSHVLKIFIRTWPYLIPMFIGYWRCFPSGVAGDRVTQDGWSFRYVGVLTTLLAVLCPLFGLTPWGASWQLDVLLVASAGMTVLIWSLIFLQGRWFAVVATALVIVGTGANLFAILVVAGWFDNVQVGLVSMGCLCIWLLQYRVVAGKLQFRVRLGCHLVYYYALFWLSTLVGTVTGLFTIDLLNQSILQAQPLTPFMAGLIGEPSLSSASVDALTVAQRQGLQWVYVGFMVAVGVMMFPITAALPYYNVWIMQQINQDLRLALVERWHQLSIRYHSDHRVGDSVYRIYQDSAQVTAIIGMLLSVVTQLTMYLVTLLFVTALDPLLGLLALTIGIVALLWGRWFSPRVRGRSLVAREANSDLTSGLQEAFAAIKVIKAFGTEEIEQRRFEEDSVVSFNSAFKVRSLVAIVSIVMFTFASAVLLGGEFMMALWANEGRETFAAVLIGLIGLSFAKWNLAAFQWAQNEFFNTGIQIRGVLQQWSTAQDMAMGLDRVFTILDIEPDVKNDPDAIDMPPFRQQIRFDDIYFSYDPERPVLHGVSFEALPGSITAIVGPTGSGKSTLISLLTRIFDPDRGAITIDGNDLRRFDIESLRQNVSIALQENVLFAMSVRDNIRYVVPDADDDRVREAARVACVDDYIDGLPEGLDTLLGDRGGRLSTGQRQRLSIARAIAKDTPILILDEPTASLDAETEHRVMERLAAWGAGRAIFLITHRISTIARADQILYLDQGRLVERGSHETLMAIKNGRYRRFVETESRMSRRGVSSDE